ncbi:hypothetical protein GWN26_01065 [Candidatus Saccharibacteria bacterium]|nr:hypothetical protein [Candidatus Saccharibacteria bacterium]NIW78079.1 hypothetical protein [Calditrichia bacterium]
MKTPLILNNKQQDVNNRKVEPSIKTIRVWGELCVVEGCRKLPSEAESECEPQRFLHTFWRQKVCPAGGALP